MRKVMMLKSFCLLTAFIGILFSVSAGSLIPCPDCSRKVSRSALMCPQCGCRGEVISERAKLIPEPILGDVIDVTCDGSSSYALPIEMDGRLFAVLPLECVLGKSHITLMHAGKRVDWSVPELAIDAPIVRFCLVETNSVAWTCNGDMVFDGSKPIVEGNEFGSVVSRRISTNAFTCVGREWSVLQPKQMKNHGVQILRMLKGEEWDLLPERTHPYFKRLEKEYMAEKK